ncbi:MAG: hypothetical protein K2W96_24700 [Gemmataceae bacterium]|nr:hypothetical protein [Gemmataceae bacterium]
MGERITLDLPTGLLQRAELIAFRAGYPVTEYLSATIQAALEPFGNLSETDPEEWTDAEALEAADSRMPEADDKRLSELIRHQQAGIVRPTDQLSELWPGRHGER